MKLKFVLFISILLSGCAAQQVVSPQFASLSDENITIRAKDNSWSFRSGKTFVPPKVDNLSKHAAIPTANLEKDLSIYKKSILKKSMMDVIVEVGKKERFYGKIVFFDVYEKATSSSVKRMWSVSVPETYLNIARSGNVALLYQPYSAKQVRGDRVSWALWFSKLPL